MTLGQSSLTSQWICLHVEGALCVPWECMCVVGAPDSILEVFRLWTVTCR